MSTPQRVFLARLAGMDVFDPLGEPVGSIRDIVVVLAGQARRPRVIGLVVEVPGRKRVFVPMTRVTSLDAGQVVITGLVNLSRFNQRPTETLVLAELLDRMVTVRPDEGTEPYSALVEDLGMETERSRDWVVTKVFVRKSDTQRGSGLSRLAGRRRGETLLVDLHEVAGLQDDLPEQSADQLLKAYDEMRPADLADALHDLSTKRRREVAMAMGVGQLADVLEELPEDDQVEILTGIDTERAAEILGAMEPDDAADLLNELPPDARDDLLSLMNPGDAGELRQLMTYAEDTAGGLMTPDPVILGPEASIAEALARARREEISPALASTVYVVRPPLETPTGRLLGLVHLQALLREPPSQPVGGILDNDIEPLRVDDRLEEITRRLATYNLLSLPVVDDQQRLLGAVTVDDVLDHLLPEDWREHPGGRDGH